MTTDSVLIARQGPVAVVTLNERESRNALSRSMITGLCSFLASANDDPTLSCIVLTGAGTGFCSGGNVKDMRARNDPLFCGSPHEMQEAYRAGVQKLPSLFHALDVPCIAAVNGAAIGAGCDLACMCDIRIASTAATFAESFLRVGLVSGDGGAWLLPRIVGLPKALEMALTCCVLDAEQARECGLVTHVVEPGTLLEAAHRMATTIAELPPRSIRLNKRLIRQSLDMTLTASLELAAAFQAIVQHTTDQQEAVRALLEKRSSVFVGR